MLDSRRTILQIVPQLPGSHDGVGDYAARLADCLRIEYDKETIFVAPPLDSVNQSAHIILHYVNYGYHKRGLPLQLPSGLRRLRQTCGGKLLTVFHEIYASSPPWQSAFWLQPWQKSIARNIAHISDACVVSSEVMRDMLLELAPAVPVSVHPVISTLGEPTFSSDQFARRDPHRWVIFGGTHLLKRSLQSFRRRFALVPDAFSPRELFLLGGAENQSVRDEVDQIPGVECHYHPAIDAGVASEILSSCSFGWIDYFRQPNIPMAVILKSGSFASYCAHGVIPVLPQAGSEIAVNADRLPGPYCVGRDRTNLPAKSERAKVSHEIYNWYARRAASENLARGIIAVLRPDER